MRPEQHGPLRVLVVDDSVAYRHFLKVTLADIPGVTVTAGVGTLASARAWIGRGEIDAITLDVELDGESGLDLLAWLSATLQRIPVILVSGRATVGPHNELDAAFLGAIALVPKPSGANAAHELRERLEPLLTGLMRRHVPRGDARPTARPARREVIAIGASTGGPPVLAALLAGLPTGFDVPIVITQHLPKGHTAYFADQLALSARRPVTIATEGAALERCGIYLAPGDRHLIVVPRGAGLSVALDAGPPEHFCRPAVDPMFRSVAAAVGGAAIGVVLTGMGGDGAQGAIALRAAGAPVVVQDEATSVVWGMPGAVVAAGAADAVEPVDRIGARIVEWCRAATRQMPLVALTAQLKGT